MFEKLKYGWSAKTCLFNKVEIKFKLLSQSEDVLVTIEKEVDLPLDESLLSFKFYEDRWEKEGKVVKILEEIWLEELAGECERLLKEFRKDEIVKCKSGAFKKGDHIVKCKYELIPRWEELSFERWKEVRRILSEKNEESLREELENQIGKILGDEK